MVSLVIMFSVYSYFHAQVLKSKKFTTLSSKICHDSEEKSNSSSDSVEAQMSSKKKSGSSALKNKSSQSESASSNGKSISQSSDSEVGPGQEESTVVSKLSLSKSESAGKSVINKRNSKRVAERVLLSIRKRQKRITSDSDSVVSGSVSPDDASHKSNSRKENEDAATSLQIIKPRGRGRPRKKLGPVPSDPHASLGKETTTELLVVNYAWKEEESVDQNKPKQEISDDKSWKAIEKSLLEKGVDIFGRNRLVTEVICIP